MFTTSFFNATFQIHQPLTTNKFGVNNMSAFLLIKYTKPNDTNNINSPAAKIAPYEKVNNLNSTTNWENLLNKDLGWFWETNSALVIYPFKRQSQKMACLTILWGWRLKG